MPERTIINPTPGRAPCRAPVSILGVPIDPVTTAETLDMIGAMISSREPHYIVTVNVDFLVQATEDVELRRILFDSHLALCDGTPVLWASKILGNSLPERVAGSDLMPLLLGQAEQKGWRVFFLGSTPETAAAALEKIRLRYPDLVIAGHYSPPFSPLLAMDHDQILTRIKVAKPDLLFVCFGCPKQEKFMAMHHRELNIPVSIGIGGTMDFFAGQLRRAPAWMRRTGFEWLYRLAQEPKRLFKRYTKDFWVFGSQLGRQCLRLRRMRANASNQKLRLADSKTPFTRLVLPPTLDCLAVTQSEAEWQRVLAEPAHCIADASSVRFVDSTGIGLLIRLKKGLGAANKRIVIVGASSAMKRAVSLMRLQDFFHWAPTPGAARLELQRVAEIDLVRTCLKYGQAHVTWIGEITAANAPGVWQRTSAALSNSASEWVLDLSQVTFIDSTGLGLLVRCRKAATATGVSLSILGCSRAAKNVISLAKLDKLVFGENAGSKSGPDNRVAEGAAVPLVL